MISEGDSWKYYDQGIALENASGTAWRSNSFDDSGWSNGNGELGYGDEDANGNPAETTVVGFGPSSSNKFVTTYFRKDFVVPAGDISSVELRIKRDDGAAVYINGVEVTEARSNLPSLQSVPAGGITYAMPALQVIGGEDEKTFQQFPIPASYLIAGNNTIAVEIHQQSGNSSDISFDASLEISSISGAEPSNVTVNESTQIKARLLTNDGTWSALADASFLIDGEAANADNLRLTEIYYNPIGDGVEFLEVQNVSGSNVTLDGIVLTDGPADPLTVIGPSTLEPGEYGFFIEAGNQAAFLAANPGVSADQIIGQWADGGLSNSGENIRLVDAAGDEIIEVDYTDGDLWSVTADGGGASLELIDPMNTPANLAAKPYSWRGSVNVGGSAGAASISPTGIVINEILAHTDSPLFDSIELYNPTDSAIDIGGWFLSDDPEVPLKYEINPGTIIEANEYFWVSQSDFDVAAIPFSLSSTGEQVVLTQSNDGATASRFEDAVEFFGTFNGQSLGRIPGDMSRLAPLTAPSLGLLNGGFEWSEVTISEVHYHPADPELGGCIRQRSGIYRTL